MQASTGLAVGTAGQMHAALTNVRDSSGHALAEVRSLVGALRDQDTGTDVSGDVTTIPSLADAARESGVGLCAQLPDAATLARWQEQWPAQPRLTVLRVVQEGLTNIIKHGGSHPQAELIVREQGADVVVQVRNDHAGAVSDAGFGLAGLHERVQLAGGTLEAGPDQDGFGVRAAIPTTMPEHRDQP